MSNAGQAVFVEVTLTPLGVRKCIGFCNILNNEVLKNVLESIPVNIYL